MLEHKKGSYVHVNDMLAWLDDLTDDDNYDVILTKIVGLQVALGDL